MTISIRNETWHVRYIIVNKATGIKKRKRVNTGLEATPRNLKIIIDTYASKEETHNVNLDIPSDKEVKVLINAADGMLKNFIAIMYFLNLRPSELISLKWRDIDFGCNTMQIFNSRSSRKITDEVKPYLEAQIMLTVHHKSNVFVNRFGKEYISTTLLTRMFNTLLKKVNMKVCKLYTLRAI